MAEERVEMMSQYLQLDSEESPMDDNPLMGEPSIIKSNTTNRSRGFTFFVVVSVFSVVISFLNLSLLSASQTYRHLSKPLKTPNVYIGLDKVNYSEPLCRSRTVYPVAYSTFKGSDIKRRKPIVAPEDRVILSFGADVRSHLLAFPDYILTPTTGFCPSRLLPSRLWPRELYPNELPL